MSRGKRKAMIQRDHPDISLSQQCQVLAISRSSFYYAPKGESSENLALMRRIDELFLKYPFYGSRQMVRQFFPYLLRNLDVNRPNQVWCADITYIPVQRGFLYLVAIMDWATRHVLAWRLSNTMDAGFCVEALAEALAKFGKPEIFNTDQGSQFTSFDFTGVLKDADIRIPINVSFWLICDLDDSLPERPVLGGNRTPIPTRCQFTRACPGGLRQRRAQAAAVSILSR